MNLMLPIHYPPVTSYAHHTAILSILSVDDSYLPWFCNNYFHLHAKKNPLERTDLDFYIDVRVITSNKSISSQYLSRDSVLNKDIISFFIDCLNQGNYIYVVINGYYISSYESYKKEDFLHPLFIYGYDIHNRTFNIADFFTNGKFTFSKATFFEIEQAYKNLDPHTYWWEGINLFKYKKENTSQNLDEFKTIFEEYLLGIKPSRRYEIDQEGFDHLKLYENEDRVYGIGIYDRLILDLNSLLNKNGVFDNRALPILAEHKKVMVTTITLLENNGYVHSKIDAYKDIQNDSELVRNLLLKYGITGENVYLKRAINILILLREKEKNVISATLQDWTAK